MGGELSKSWSRACLPENRSWENKDQEGSKWKFSEGTRKLDHILNSQRPLGIKISLGYSKTQESSIRKIKFMFTRFKEPQSREKKHHEIINEDKREARKRGDRQWSTNQSVKWPRYFPDQFHNNFNNMHSATFGGGIKSIRRTVCKISTALVWRKLVKLKLQLQKWSLTYVD